MEKTGNAVACLSILSTLCMGCYSSALIEPTAAEMENIYTDHIDYVVTKDGKKYDFEEPPVVTNDTISGRWTTSAWRFVRSKEVSIPLSDVAEISVSRYNAVKTWIWVGAIGATIAVTAAILANNPIEFGPGTSGHW
jgi:hypothetical protein